MVFVCSNCTFWHLQQECRRSVTRVKGGGCERDDHCFEKGAKMPVGGDAWAVRILMLQLIARPWLTVITVAESNEVSAPGDCETLAVAWLASQGALYTALVRIDIYLQGNDEQTEKDLSRMQGLGSI